MNILASGVYNHNMLLEIVDCTGYVLKGLKKCAVYISDFIKPRLKRLDPEKYCVDMVLFDGASNMKKCGRTLGA